MLKKLPKWPQDGHLGPNLEALGAILPHLGEILVDPSPAKIDQNHPRQLSRDFLLQGRPQELPDPLQTSIFHVFKYIFQRFSSFLSEQLFIDSAIVFNTFSLIFFGCGPLERSWGAAVLARRASSIIYTCFIVHACIYSSIFKLIYLDLVETPLDVCITVCMYTYK